MANDGQIDQVESGLESQVEDLRRREPIFHRPAFGKNGFDWEQMMAPDYWEVGASGRRYSRQFILDHLAKQPPVDAEAAGWRCWDFGLRPLGPDTFLLTYSLDQNGRISRRSTIWQHAGGAWRILFHQGTIVAGGADDSLPSAG